MIIGLGLGHRDHCGVGSNQIMKKNVETKNSAKKKIMGKFYFLGDECKKWIHKKNGNLF